MGGTSLVYVSGQATIQRNNCGACVTLADKFDDYYDSKAGIDDLIKRITDQMCADDDCKKNRIAKITPLVVNLVDQESHDARCLPIHLQLLCREIRVQRRLLQYLQN